MKENQPVESERAVRLDLFCCRVEDDWRVHVLPGWLPAYLRRFFDAEGEAFPVVLDFEDMNRFLAQHRVTIEQRTTRLGGVELSARGEAASVLAQWLSTAFASGVRVPVEADEGATARSR